MAISLPGLCRRLDALGTECVVVQLHRAIASAVASAEEAPEQPQQEPPQPPARQKVSWYVVCPRFGMPTQAPECLTGLLWCSRTL